jgi:hypothetical protein
VTFDSLDDAEPAKTAPPKEPLESSRPGPHKSKRLGALDLSDLTPEPAAALPPLAAPPKR